MKNKRANNNQALLLWQQPFLNDRFILWLIIVNSIIVFLGGFSFGEKVYWWLMLLDSVITLLFLLELIVKVRIYSLSEYIKSSWNIMDMTLVFLALPSAIYWIAGSNEKQISIFLVFRVLRVFKFFRFFTFIPDIYSLIKGVKRALKASLFVMIAFLIYSFVFAVISSYLFKDLASDYFANPAVSFYTIFQLFTIEGWYEIPEAAAEGANTLQAFWIKTYFVIMLLTGGIFGLSIINSIFVDAMVSDNNEALERKIDRLEHKIDNLSKNK